MTSQHKLIRAIDQSDWRGFFAVILLSCFILWLILVIIFIFVLIFMLNTLLGFTSIILLFVIMYKLAVANTDKADIS